MSHATLLVIGEGDLDERMAPYNEQTEDPEYREFNLEIHDEDAVNHMRETLTDPKNSQYAKEYRKGVTLKEFMERWHGYEQNEDDDGYGGWGYFCNPHAKWDWYQVGGRWRGLFVLKEGRKGYLGDSGVFDNPPAELGGVDRACACDIDWERTNNCSKSDVFRYTKEWEELIGSKAEFQMYKPEYYLARYKTLENYLKARTSFGTFAVLDDDQIWHEAGQMGMFATVSCEPEEECDFEIKYFERFIEPIMATDTLLTLVDFHI